MIMFLRKEGNEPEDYKKLKEQLHFFTQHEFTEE